MVVMLGVREGVVVESGLEFGFTIGIDEAGLMAGFIVGTVVIGVVMSLWVVEIWGVNFGLGFGFTLSLFSVSFDPVLEIKLK